MLFVLRKWRVWKKIPGTRNTEADAKASRAQIKATIPEADVGEFNWHLIDRDQRNFELKMMVLLCFKDDVILPAAADL